MRLIYIVLIVFGSVSIGIAQNDIISVSKDGYYFYGDAPFKISNYPIPLNLSYERVFSNKLALKAKVGFFRLSYSPKDGFVNYVERGSRLDLRDILNISVGLRKYFELTDNLEVYPTFNATLRGGTEVWFISREPPGTPEGKALYESVQIDGIGIGGGVGAKYSITDHFIVGLEILHREFTHKRKESQGYMYESSAWNNIGAKHQLSVSFSFGIAF